ncbi:hypothetical protein GW17_00031466 [Ensete ventricosum]|nr:hypothetical protein GW17_00031466 [Ensete ventricosum]
MRERRRLRNSFELEINVPFPSLPFPSSESLGDAYCYKLEGEREDRGVRPRRHKYTDGTHGFFSFLGESRSGGLRGSLSRHPPPRRTSPGSSSGSGPHERWSASSPPP